MLSRGLRVAARAPMCSKRGLCARYTSQKASRVRKSAAPASPGASPTDLNDAEEVGEEKPSAVDRMQTKSTAFLARHDKRDKEWIASEERAEAMKTAERRAIMGLLLTTGSLAGWLAYNHFFGEEYGMLEFDIRLDEPEPAADKTAAQRDRHMGK